MACLCAPTTHEGSFRCRLHRAAPQLASHSAQFASKGSAFASTLPEISDQPCRIRPHADPPSPRAAAAATAAPLPTPAHYLDCNLHSFSSSSSSPSSRSAPSSTSAPSPPPQKSRYARLPPAKRAISSSTTLARSLYSGSPSAAATRCTIAPSASHAAALAIMKQHLHNKHTKNHANRNNTALRSSTGYKIGPSRLSRMGRACAVEEPLLKKVDCCTPNPPPQHTLSRTTSSFCNSGQLASMEATQVNFKLHSTIAKFKQSESSCKIVGYKAGSFITSAVY